MKKRIILLCVCGMIFYHATAQKEGDSWMIGYTDDTGLVNFGIITISFPENEPEIKYDRYYEFSFSGTASNVCDSEGVPLLWTNGMQIHGRGNTVISDSISYWPDPQYWNWWYLGHPINAPDGLPNNCGALILPCPGKDSTYYVFSHTASKINTTFFIVKNWLISEIVYGKTNSQIIYQDSIFTLTNDYTSHLNAVRHANGRDWWILFFDYEFQKSFVFYCDSEGIHFSHSEDLGVALRHGGGQTTFSPKGNYFARSVAGYKNQQMVDIFSFDRCSGKINHLEHIYFMFWTYGGVAFSPSEKYLYTTIRHHILQYDLTAEDIMGSAEIVAERQPGNHTFGPLLQAPDDKIYVVTTEASSRTLHVIERPDEHGEACSVKQDAIALEVYNNRTAPNIPNYRLGPLDGSPCDTLGIDNKATSRWRWEVNDPSDPLTIRFTDLAFYEPDTWAWTFDDGNTSDVPSPIHTFPDYGLYHVCQTVENEYQRDSTCKWIELMPTVSTDDPTYSRFSVQPNPFDDELKIRYNGSGYTSGTIMITDLHGRVVLQTGEVPIPITLEMPDIPSGMYICTIRDKAGKTTTIKVVKQ